jgi:hypothetical protein
MPNADELHKAWLRSWIPKFKWVRSPRLALRVLDTLLLPSPAWGGLWPEEIERLRAHFREQLEQTDGSGEK